MKTPALKARCPQCGLTNLIPVGVVRIVSLPDDRIRYDCDDCGTVTRRIPFAKIAELVAAGMPNVWSDEDVVGFQVAVAFRDDLADIADLEGASS